MKELIIVLMIVLMAIPCSAMVLRSRGDGRYVDTYGRLWVIRDDRLYINGHYVQRMSEEELADEVEIEE